MNRKTIFRLYLIIGIYAGVVIETVNYNVVSGIGLIAYLLIMILYFVIFAQESTQHQHVEQEQTSAK